MRNLSLLLLLALTLCKSFWPTTATAQAPLTTSAKICVDAAHARTIADSLAALPDCRQEARKWQYIADSTQAVADQYREASARNLDAKRAAENAEGFQRNIAESRAVQVQEYKVKAHRRGAVVAILVAVDIFVGWLLVSHL